MPTSVRDQHNNPMPGMPTLEARAVSLSFDGDRMLLELADGREVSVPLAWFPRLQQATEAERTHYRLMGNGEGIHWEDLDEDLSVPLLLGLPCE
jgi:hypothetical protein